MSDATPAKPVLDAPLWESIPAALAHRQQWVLWKYEWSGKRSCWLKVPYYVAGGRRTDVQGCERDRQRLATLPVVRAAYERKAGFADAFSGIGFAFLPDDGLMGIDLDKHVDPISGAMSERCQKIIAAFNTFTEISPSGTGVHLYLLGKTETAKSNDIGVEMFCEKQYFTVTGKHVAGTPMEVVQADEAAVRRMHVTIQEAKDRLKVAANPPAQQVAGAKVVPVARAGRDDFRYVNDVAMAALHAWVPVLFGGREIKSGAGYRVTSKALGRDLQEDLSINPNGIVDFGVADMGDARGGARTPIDLVAEWGPGTGKPRDALLWLAKVLSVQLQPYAPPPVAGSAAAKAGRANDSAAAGGEVVGEDASASGGGSAGNGGGGKRKKRGGHDDDGEGLGPLWDKLVHGKNGLLDCRENVMYCMLLAPVLAGMVRLNKFTLLLDRARDTPWGHAAGEWDEEDDLMLGEYLLSTFGLSIKAKSTLRDGVMMAARHDKYNPIEDMIRAEPWDGVQRLEHWLTEVYGIDERPYTQLIGKCFMMGLVNRAINPGCKFDYMLILKGEQGLKKSSAWRALAYPYFTDNAIRVGEKDSQMAQQLAWIVESAELESLNKSESTAIKQYLSAQEDWYRPPYGAQMVRAKRHFVNVGTTNADAFLRDATGDRRFWPIEVFQVNAERLTELRQQLLAEALVRLEAGERYWPDRDEEKSLIFPEQEQFKRSDPWEDLLDNYVNGSDGLKLGDKAPSARSFFPRTEMYQVLQIKADRMDNAGVMDQRISNAMKVLGFKIHRETTGKRLRGFLRVLLEDVAGGAEQTPVNHFDAGMGYAPAVAQKGGGHALPF